MTADTRTAHPDRTDATPTSATDAGATDDDAFRAAWAEWHERKDAQLADPHGFLAVTGLHWLGDRPQQVPGAPGAWSTGPGGVVVDLAEAEELTVDGRPVHGRHAFGPIPERGGVLTGSGDAVVEVARRGGHDIVRPRHPGHPLRTAFAGTPAFEPDRRWVAAGRFEPFAQPRPTTVGAAVEGLEHVYDAVGSVAFALGGRELSLTAFPGKAPGTLLVLFTDATSGLSTYGAVRSLALDTPDADGRVVLDFNRATNLPCAYTDFATCPLPPAENRLPVAVEAGEKIPFERLPTHA
jgi:uncharacterized protein (DUF1684 family)